MKGTLNKKKSTAKDFQQINNVVEELHNFINDLLQLKTSELFRVKLTPEYCNAIGIPDYHRIITKPMDLPTIKVHSKILVLITDWFDRKNLKGRSIKP